MRPGDRKGCVILVLCGSGAILFSSLGIWQLERRLWKLDLISRVDANIHAAPSPVPPATSWSRLDLRSLEYRRVRAAGRWLHDKETRVDALTERGGGHWVVTPLRTADGIILVNRGFVPKGRAAFSPASEESPPSATVTGLLRRSEPGGRFLRPNRPGQERWYSRDVPAIAERRGLRQVAPFFIDADAAPNPGGFPVGGLTVIRFRNTHLIYALTWFALAGLCLTGLFLISRGKPKS